MDFRTALSRNLPPSRLGPVRLRYADSCLVLDVELPASRRAAAASLGIAALSAGLLGLALLAEPAPSSGGLALGLELAAACCAALAATLERDGSCRRCLLLFDREEAVLELRGRAFRRSRAVRLPFDAVTSLRLEGGTHLVLRAGEPGGGDEAYALVASAPARAHGELEELRMRLCRMFALSEEGERRAPRPPNGTDAPGAPPGSG